MFESKPSNEFCDDMRKKMRITVLIGGGRGICPHLDDCISHNSVGFGVQKCRGNMFIFGALKLGL